MKKPRTAKPEGLVGFFGHTYEPDDGDPELLAIQYQFKIIRPFPPGRWIVQLYSFMDGDPTRLAVYDETFLLGPKVKLYATAELWNDAYSRHQQTRRYWKEDERMRLLEHQDQRDNPIEKPEELTP
jgi:hypothetical protein